MHINRCPVLVSGDVRGRKQLLKLILQFQTQLQVMAPIFTDVTLDDRVTTV